MPNNAALDWYLSNGVENTSDGSSNSYESLGPLAYVVFASCWTLLFHLYLFLTSDTTYTRSEKSVGRFFNKSFALAVNCLSTIFWFGGFISLARFSEYCNANEEAICGTLITSTLAGVGIWYYIAHP